MNEFESLEQLNEAFRLGRFTLPRDIMVMGIPYHYSTAVGHTVPEMKNENKKLFVVYAVEPHVKASPDWKNTVEERRLQEWIILIWALDRTLSVRPARAVTNSAARARADLETGEHSLRENQAVVADSVTIRFPQFNKQLTGKVDTGANLSSLHCEEWKVDSGRNMVEFRSSLLSNNTIRTELIDQAAIKTSEGSEYRPVIALNISIAGKDIQNAKFNLNDRSQMQDKILIGQNILERGNFLVDPTKQHNRFEDVDWDALQDLYKDITVLEETTLTNEKVHQMILGLVKEFGLADEIIKQVK